MEQERRRDKSPQLNGKIICQGETYYRLHISHIPRDFDVEDITRLFSHYGETNRIFFHRAHGWAFVEYQSIEQAKAAINGLNNITPYFMVVKFAKNTHEYNYYSKKHQKIHSNERIKPCIDEAQTLANIDLTDCIEQLPFIGLIPQYTLGEERLIQKWVNEVTNADNTFALFKPGSCRRCETKSNLMCSTCKIWYCSEACSRADWHKHQTECYPRIATFTPDGTIIYTIDKSQESHEVRSTEMDDPNDEVVICETNPMPDVSAEKPIAQKTPPISTETYSKVCIVCVGLPYYWVVLIENCPLLLKVEKALADHCNNPCNLPDPTLVNKCCALFEGDWYRAKILSKTKSTAKVRFVDYGNESEVKLEEIKTLPPELSSMKPLAIKIQLVEHTLDESNLEPSYDIKAIKMVGDVCLVQLKDKPQSVQELKPTKLSQSTDVVLTHETHLEETQNKLNVESSNHTETMKMVNDGQSEKETEIARESNKIEIPLSTDEFAVGDNNKPIRTINDIVVTEELKMELKTIEMPQYTDELPAVCTSQLKEDTQNKMDLDKCDQIKTIKVVNDTQVEEELDTTPEIKITEIPQSTSMLIKVCETDLLEAGHNALHFENSTDIVHIQTFNDAQLKEEQQMIHETIQLNDEFPDACETQELQTTQHLKTTEMPQPIDESFKFCQSQVVEDTKNKLDLISDVQLKEEVQLSKESNSAEMPQYTNGFVEVCESHPKEETSNKFDLERTINIEVDQAINHAQFEKELEMLQELKHTEMANSTDGFVEVHESHPKEDTQNKLDLISDVQLKEEVQISEESNSAEMPQSTNGFVEVCESHPKEETSNKLDLERTINIEVDQAINHAQFEEELEMLQELEPTEMAQSTDGFVEVHESHPKKDTLNKLDLISDVQLKEEVQISEESNSAEMPQSTNGFVEVCESHPKEETSNKLDLERTINIEVDQAINHAQFEEELEMLQELEPTEMAQSTDGFVEVHESHPKKDTLNKLDLISDVQLKEEVQLSKESNSAEMPQYTNGFVEVCESHPKEETSNKFDLERTINIEVDQAINHAQFEKELEMLQELKHTEMANSTDGFVEVHESHPKEDTQNKLDLISVQIKEVQISEESNSAEMPQSTNGFVEVCESHPKEETSNKLDLQRTIKIEVDQAINHAQFEKELEMLQELEPTEMAQSTDGFVEVHESHPKEDTQNQLDLESRIEIKVIEVISDVQLIEEVQISEESNSTEMPQSTNGFVEVCESHPKEETSNKLDLQRTINIEVDQAINHAQFEKELEMLQELEPTEMAQSTDGFVEVHESHPKEDTQNQLDLESRIEIQVIEVAIDTEVPEEPEMIQGLKPTGESFEVSKPLAEVTQNNLNFKRDDDIKAIKMVKDSELRKKSEITPKSTPTRFSLSTDEFIEVLTMTPVQPDEYWVILHERFSDLLYIDNRASFCGSDNRVNKPILNEMYLVRFEDEWCRATVIELNPLLVFYIDYGSLDLRKTEDLYEVPNDIRNIHPMAIKIKLARGTSHRFLNLDPHSVLKVKLISLLPDSTYLVQVMDASSEEE